MIVESLHEKLLDFYNDLRSQYYPELEASGIRELYEFKDGIYTAGFLIELLRSKNCLVPFDQSEFKTYDEFAFITQDLKYTIGMLSIVRPYINNPLREQGTYRMTFEDHLYLRYSSIGYPYVYAFWDRIGDLLYHYFDTGLKKDQVFIARVLNNLPNEVKARVEYHALFEVYDKDVKPALERRHGIVHDFSLKSETRWKHINSYGNPEKMEADYMEKFNYRDNLMALFLSCLKGYRLMLDLIGTITDK